VQQHSESVAPTHLRFVDITQRSGIDFVHTSGSKRQQFILESMAGGGAFFDYDGDGFLDLFLVNGGAVEEMPEQVDRLYRNTSQDSSADALFTDVTQEAGVGRSGWGMGCAIGDYDNDGDVDLYATYWGPNVLYRNDRAGGFVDISEMTGIAHHKQPSLGIVFGDFDDDADQDLYVANDSMPNLLYRNDGNWNLEEVGTRAGVAYSEDGRAQAGMGIASGDYDNDGDLDLFVTNFSDDANTLYQNQGDAIFFDATAAAGLEGEVRPYLGWSTAFFDGDNDGWLDLFVANGHIYPQVDLQGANIGYAQRNLYYRNIGGRFLSSAASVGLGLVKVSRGAAFGDYDNDGDVDILVINLNDTPTLLENRGGNRNNWLGLELVGAASNRDALGTRVRLVVGEQMQTREVHRGYGYQSQHDIRLLFGLGSQERVERVEIRWPSGRTQLLEDPPLGRYHVIAEDAQNMLSSYGGSKSEDEQPPVALPSAKEVGGQSHPRFAAPADWTAADYLQKGIELYEQGRYEEALDVLQPAVELEPNFLEARYAIAVVLFGGLGQSEEAAAVLETAILQDSAAAKIHKFLGDIYLSLNRVDRAKQVLERAADLAPDDWESHNSWDCYSAAREPWLQRLQRFDKPPSGPRGNRIPT